MYSYLSFRPYGPCATMAANITGKGTIDKVRRIYPLVLVALGVILLVLGILGRLNVV
jgi:hypothetical protein